MIATRPLSVRMALLIALPLASIAGAPSICEAFSGATRSAWHRTFYAQNAIDTPLRAYYIPRQQGCCGRNSITGGYGFNHDHPTQDGCATCNGGWGQTRMTNGWPYPPSAAIGFEPTQFERLGQIPNDSALDPLASPAR